MELLSWEEAYETLKQGKCIAYPTDTVWGLGCLADDKERVRGCLSLKGELRSPVASVILPLSRIGAPYVKLPPEPKSIFDALPGMVTFILPTAEDCPLHHLAGEGPSIGIRVPDLAEVNTLVDRLDGPLLTTSLNFHGEAPCVTLGDAVQVARRMGIACVNMDYRCAGQSSSILKWDNGWEEIRRGPALTEKFVQEDNISTAPPSPEMCS